MDGEFNVLFTFECETVLTSHSVMIHILTCPWGHNRRRHHGQIPDNENMTFYSSCFVCTETTNIMICLYVIWGTAVAQWLRCCATNLKVAGSISDGVTSVT